MKKILIILSLVFTLFSVNAKANDQLVGHVITQVILNDNVEGMVKVMEKEIQAVAHIFALEMISVLEANLPQILEGIAAEMRLEADRKYKCELLKGSPNGCI